MSAIDVAMQRSRMVKSRAETTILKAKREGADLAALLGPSPYGGGLFGSMDQSANERKYSRFRGWVYSVVNAIGSSAASAKVIIGRKTKDGDKPKTTKTSGKDRIKAFSAIRAIKKIEWDRMPSQIQEKASDPENLEIIPNHKFQDTIDQPNPIQDRWSFVYSFVCNLCLTGWAFLIGDINEEGKLEIYSVPTSWVVPDHTEGAYSKIRIVNPNNVKDSMDAPPIERSKFSFVHIPNPADPMSGYAPTTSQLPAIKVDENIQNSQVVFFENSINPSAVVTIGKQPHPDGAAGEYRPLLTPSQRRQVYAAIRKVMAGVANYGNPAIIDGMIEKIDMMNLDQRELGWEKSEKIIRTRILSAFGIHSFALGEEMPGSYAQANIVQEMYYARINVFLSMLSLCVTNFINNFEAAPEKAANGKKAKSDQSILVWWETLKAVDPSMEKSTWESARTRQDVTQNEFRAWMGLPPDEDRNEAVIEKTAVTAVSGIAEKVSGGTLTPKQAIAILTGMGMPDKLAKEIAGDGPPEPPPDQMGGVGGPDMTDQTPVGGQSQESEDDFFAEEPADNTEDEDEWDWGKSSGLRLANKQLEKAMSLLQDDPTDEILEKSTACLHC